MYFKPEDVVLVFELAQCPRVTIVHTRKACDLIPQVRLTKVPIRLLGHARDIIQSSRQKPPPISGQRRLRTFNSNVVRTSICRGYPT